jgi:hypothetical protein
MGRPTWGEIFIFGILVVLVIAAWSDNVNL